MPTDEYFVICPYYHKAVGTGIFCEAFAADPAIPTDSCLFKQTFADRKSRNRCLKEYCTTFRYSECCIAIFNEEMIKKRNDIV